MPSALLVEKFAKKPAPRPAKFADEGPPDGDMPTGGSVGAGMDADDTETAGGGMGAEERAIDDLADVLGVAPDDRGDFANAMAAYVSAVMAETMGGAQDEDVPPMSAEGEESEV